MKSIVIKVGALALAFGAGVMTAVTVPKVTAELKAKKESKEVK